MNEAERSRHAAYMKQWRAKRMADCPEACLREERRLDRQKRERNPELYRKLSRERQARYRVRRAATMTDDEREKLNAGNRRRDTAYRVRHRERVRKFKRDGARARYWRDPQKAISITVRHQRHLAEGEVTAAQWAARLAEFGNRCAYCLRGGVPLEQDHVTPLSACGVHSIDNVVPACRSCNARKGNRFIWAALANAA